MKKQLIAIAGLAILSTPAMATKARMIALGENINDNIGSLYFSDSRNIFQNAAYANDYKDMVIMEWGASSVSATSGAKSDTDTSPQAEGGFLKSHGNYVYGLYLGAESPYTNDIRTYSRLIRNSDFHQDNQLDAFFAGESSALGKWGVNVTYSTSKNEETGVDAKQQSASLRLGMIKNKLEAFANIALINEAKIDSLGVGATPNGGTDEFKGRRGFELGATYDLEVAKVFGYVRHATWRSDTDSVIDADPGAPVVPITAYTGKFDGTYWLYQVGAGREYKVNDKATIFTKLEYLNFMRKVETASGTRNGEEINLDDYRVPATIGLEYDAASWLVVRGSVVSNLISGVDNDYDGDANQAAISPGVLGLRRPGKRTVANSTNVNAGMTLRFGELSLDGVIGTDGANNSTANEKGVLTLDNLASRVAMTYKF